MEQDVEKMYEKNVLKFQRNIEIDSKIVDVHGWEKQKLNYWKDAWITSALFWWSRKSSWDR